MNDYTSSPVLLVPVAPPPPIGWLDGIDGTGRVTGWALDKNVPEQSIQVHFYVDGNTSAGATSADNSRPDVNAAESVTGNHEFVWSIPDQFRDGKTHQLFVYGIDNAGGNNPLLPGAPKSFTLAGPSGTISVNSFPAGARGWYTLNGGDWTDSGLETPYTWTNTPVGKYHFRLEKTGYSNKEIPAQSLTEGEAISFNGTLDVLPLPQVKYFGMAHVHEASLPEIAALDSINLVMVNSESGFARILASGKKAIVPLGSIFFSVETTTPDPLRTFPGNSDSILRTDYVSRWKSFVENNHLLNHSSEIGTFYLADEPYWNNLTYEDLHAAAWLIKRGFPTTPISIVEAYPVLEHLNGSDLRVPEVVDWVGFDKYYIPHPASDPNIAADLATLKSKLTLPKQRIILIGDTFWSPSYHGANGISQDGMADVFYEQIGIVRSEPRVIVFVNFLWDTPADVPDSIGAGKLPQNVRDVYASVGKSILANPVGDRTPPSVSIVNPIDGAIVSDKSSFALAARATDDRAVSGVEFYVDGQWVGLVNSSSDQYAFVVNPLPVGTHRLEVIASDGEGNSRLSSSVSLTVIKTTMDLTAKAKPTALELSWQTTESAVESQPVK